MLDQEYKSIKLHRDDWVLNVTLNRPNVRNAMSLEMVNELGQVFTALESDLSVRAVVLARRRWPFLCWRRYKRYGWGHEQQLLKVKTIRILN